MVLYAWFFNLSCRYHNKKKQALFIRIVITYYNLKARYIRKIYYILNRFYNILLVTKKIE